MKFDTAIDFILNLEGGYIDDPKDRGGETNFGISKRAFPDLDIKNLDITTAKQIYKDNYWLKIKGSLLPDKLDCAVLDCAINQGVRAACLLLQQVLMIEMDGTIGPKTIEACRAFDKVTLTQKYLNARLERYRKTSGFDRYGKGWFNRVDQLKKFLKV